MMLWGCGSSWGFRAGSIGSAGSVFWDCGSNWGLGLRGLVSLSLGFMV